MKRLLLTATTLALLTGGAYAFGDTYILPAEAPKSAQPGSYFLENVNVKQNPMDYGRLNESPIRGKGRISVVHNESAPDDPNAEIIKAIQLLHDNGWQVSRRR